MTMLDEATLPGPLALGSSEGLGAWLPIATAPREGTAVLLWLADDIDRCYVSGNRAPRLTIGFWGWSNDDFSPGDAWHSVEAKEEMFGMGGEMTGPMTSTDCLQVVPTHWMPLPAPPVSA